MHGWNQPALFWAQAVRSLTRLVFLNMAKAAFFALVLMKVLGMWAFSSSTSMTKVWWEFWEMWSQHDWNSWVEEGWISMHHYFSGLMDKQQTTWNAGFHFRHCIVYLFKTGSHRELDQIWFPRKGVNWLFPSINLLKMFTSPLLLSWSRMKLQNQQLQMEWQYEKKNNNNLNAYKAVLWSLSGLSVTGVLEKKKIRSHESFEIISI